jgi:hypothetical protein
MWQLMIGPRGTLTLTKKMPHVTISFDHANQTFPCHQMPCHRTVCTALPCQPVWTVRTV